MAENRPEGSVSAELIQIPLPKLELPNLQKMAIPPVQIARIARLSFKEGMSTITEKETENLEAYAQIDMILSNKASARLNELMTAAYKLGELVARGEA